MNLGEQQIMDEQRLKAYRELIEQILSCAEGA
jgi:hypothetical protein